MKLHELAFLVLHSSSSSLSTHSDVTAPDGHTATARADRATAFFSSISQQPAVSSAMLIKQLSASFAMT